MELRIGQDVLDLFPDLAIGVVLGDVRAIGPSFEKVLTRARDDAMDQIDALAGLALTEQPPIAVWREAYRKFGAKPKKYAPTHEALAKRLLKDQGFPEINPIVDLYLANQTRFLLPHGGYDLRSVVGPLSLERSAGGESFVPIGGSAEEVTEAGEVIYKDQVSVLTRRWNYKDCDRTKITHATSSFVLMIEVPETTAALPSIDAAAETLARAFAEGFDGSFRFEVFRPAIQGDTLRM
ncbi:MAG: hypothetical protein KDD11_16380 [Acidobacteria bacterium]|nr:hypothetical protein [Acidobacteriota bacterium]